MKFFTHAQLKRAAQIAHERDYNRQLDLDAVDALDTHDLFPITFEMPHEHRHGEPVPLHIRCLVVVDGEGSTALIDTDLDLWRSLGEHEVPNPTHIAVPSNN